MILTHLVFFEFFPGAGEAIEQDLRVGGDDAWLDRSRSHKVKGRFWKKEDLVEELKAAYFGLDQEEKLEIKHVVAQFSEEKTPRRSVVPASNIDFEKLSKNVSAVEKLLKIAEFDAKERFRVQKEAEDEQNDEEMLLMSA